MPNRLAKETSPYLLQHQDNPVDWYPWGEEALNRARQENKPILLSIGYSACHWCHVMEHESFENGDTAALMNENFINIKVDREERPDLDRIYQNVAQAITRSGGWPLTVFLTPELKPFYGGTYFPPQDSYGRPGFPRVLRALSDAYRTQPEDVAENSVRLVDYLQEVESIRVGAGQPGRPLGREELLLAAGRTLDAVDWENGGLGGAPKFPNPMNFAFLWRVAAVKDSETDIPDRAAEAVLLTLEKMARGGIYDQLGGGFHRYAVDQTWSVPHFEKMLYDNGLLLRLYSEVLLTADSAGIELSPSRRALFQRVVAETVRYLMREMRAPEGGFFAAQDADSEGGEGAFFAWRPEDLEKFLSQEEASAACSFFGIDEAGNFEEGKTVLSLVREPGENEALFLQVKKKMLEARSRRVAPATDHKLLASWNGLVISGLCWASRALAKSGEPALAKTAIEAARGAFAWVRNQMVRPEGRLWSNFQAGNPRFNAYLDDYAFLAQAGLDLARFAEKPHELQADLALSAEWVRTILKNFSDSSGGPGFYFTSDDHETLIHRSKSVEDQAIPSGTAVALECCAVLSEIDPTGAGAGLEKEVERQLSALSAVLRQSPHGYGELLCASLLSAAGPVVVSGPQAHEVVFHPHVFQKAAEGERYLLCHGHVCLAPMSSKEELSQAVLKKITPLWSR